MRVAEVDSIITRNREHNRILFSEYDPTKGIGSPIAREKLYITDKSYILIPYYLARTEQMRDIMACGSVEKYAESKGIDKSVFRQVIARLRIKYDFEFWAATCATILDKESGQEIKFKLRRAQRKLLKVLVEQLFDNKPVRVILLKARQWGGSTLVQLFMSWIQLFHRKNWNSVIAAHLNDAARNIRSMYTLMADRHPKDILSVKFRSFEGSTNNRQVVGRGNVIYIGSMEAPNSLHSGNYKLVHCSEVGLWKETLNRKPSDFVNAFAGSVPSIPFTMVVLESTAKGEGNFFHQTWKGAVAGENAYTPIFVAWWEIDMYRSEFKSEQEMREFAASLTEDEMYRFNLGATLEGLKWYRAKRGEYQNDWDMKEGFPSTPEEAFTTSGHKAHHPLYIKQMEGFAKQPKWIGELFADSTSGAGALNESLVFGEQSNGQFYIWKKPDATNKYLHRYVVSLDIGGRHSGADWSIIRVIDRLKILDGGVPEVIATYRFHLDQDLTAWRAAQVAKWYDNALLVVERNSLREMKTEGNHVMTILDTIKDFYPNIYFRDDPDKIKEGMPVRYGFFTGKGSKELIVDTINRGLREMGFIDYDARFYDECSTYELKPNGSYGAVDGYHDDIYMSTGIGLYVSSTLPLPKLKPDNQSSATKQRVRTAADFS